MKIKNPFKKQKMTVWHPASPGLRVEVYRTWFGRLFKSKDFATLGEVSKAVRRDHKFSRRHDDEFLTETES